MILLIGGTSAAASQDEKEIEIENLKHKREFWKNNVMRKTSVHPGEDFGGIFYIPIERFAKKLKVVMPLHSVKHEFEFDQVAID